LASGHPLLFVAAFENLKKWTFKRPFDGDADGPDVTMVYTFELPGAGVRGDAKMEFLFEFPNHVRLVFQPACADHVPCTPEERQQWRVDQDAMTANRIPILTVCEALRDPSQYDGQTVIVVGRSIATSEGSWLSENCGLKLTAEGRTYSATISTAYAVSEFAPPPQMPKSFKWDKSALQHALDIVKATTHLETKEHWGAVYGRLETAPTHEINLRDGSVATIVGYGHLNGAPAQLVSPELGFLRLKGK
jgi:hypothetical protein